MSDFPPCGTVGDGGIFRCSMACRDAGDHVAGQPIDAMDWIIVNPSEPAERKRAALKADAERLAELRAELAARGKQRDEALQRFLASNGPEIMQAARNAGEEFQRCKILVAIYEECAARGRTFGGCQ